MAKNIAIITGGSSGFGKEFVKLLNEFKNIDEIWAISRNIDKLNDLQLEFGEKIKIFSVDLSNTDNIQEFKKELEKEEINISFLVNNAGYAKFCSYNDLSIDDSINMINLNVSGVVTMGLVCIPFMKRGSHIINIASQAAFQPLPYLNIYAATKAFVKNYSMALNEELKEKGIVVTAVCPGWMNTKLFERGFVEAQKAPKYFYGMIEPKLVAKKALSDAMKNKNFSTYGIDVKLSIFMAKILPAKWIMKFWLFQQKIK